MLMDRIIGAFTFRKEVYAEVEKDETFTSTAWLLVAVVAFISQLFVVLFACNGLRKKEDFTGHIAQGDVLERMLFFLPL